MQVGIATVLFFIGIGFVIVANFVGYTMFGEINGKRQPGEQMSMLFANVRFFQIWSEHERAFPHSRHRLYFVSCFLLGLACIVTALCYVLLSG
jgi:hypothetical protein